MAVVAVIIILMGVGDVGRGGSGGASTKGLKMVAIPPPYCRKDRCCVLVSGAAKELLLLFFIGDSFHVTMVVREFGLLTFWDGE